MNKKNIILFIVNVVLLAGMFLGGVYYSKSQIPGRGQGGIAGTFTRGNAGGGTRNAGGFTTGQIIAKDVNSITVQLMAGEPGSTTQGGSKIVFFGAGTTVTKTVTGSVGDLIIGTQVSITGTPNTDGSENAQAVQIRPNVPAVVR